MDMFGWMHQYAKPGPGIGKDEPEKKGLFRFIEIYFRKFWQMMLLNLLHLLLSLPLITIGWADCGLAFCTRNYTREKHAFVPGDFFAAIRKNRSQAFWMGLANLLLTAVLIFNIAAYESQGVLFVVSCFMLIVFLFMQNYIPLLIVTFKFTWKQIYKNAFLLAFIGFLPNLLILLLTAPFYLLAVSAYLNGYADVLIFFLAVYVFLFPAFKGFLTQFCVFPVVKRTLIDPYYRRHPQADIEVRRSLNIEVEKEREESREKIFTDRGSEEETAPAEGAAIPRQYRASELRGFRKRAEQDEDGTI